MSRYSIDDLVQMTDTPSSTVRMYRHRGLIDPPTRQGRKALYDDHHVQQLALIDRLKARGYSLAAIQEIVELRRQGGSARNLIEFDDDAPMEMELTELVNILFPDGEIDPSYVQRAADLGLLELSDEGVEIKRPGNLRTGTQLMAMGVPGDVVLDEYEHLKAITDGLASRFADLFEKHILDTSESPAAAYQTLLELAGAVVEATLLQSLSEEGERRLGG